jgi:hypothetical protein
MIAAVCPKLPYFFSMRKGLKRYLHDRQKEQDTESEGSSYVPALYMVVALIVLSLLAFWLAVNLGKKLKS